MLFFGGSAGVVANIVSVIARERASARSRGSRAKP